MWLMFGDGVNKMKKYAKIIDNTTKEVQIGVGCPDSYYIEIGMTLKDVEQAYNGLWYIEGYAPTKPAPSLDEKKKAKREERDGYLNDIQWRVERYDSQVKLGVTPNDSEEVYMSILRYMQYLRDIPQDPAFPDVEIKTFEEWR